MATKMAPGAAPRPGRVSKQEQCSPRNLSAMAAELCIVFGKILQGLGFFRRDQFIVQRASPGDPRGAGVPPAVTPLTEGSVGLPLGSPSGSGSFFYF